MADSIEFDGATEEEAIQRAAVAVGVEADALDYTVVDEGSSGVFGLGSRPVKIRVRPPEGFKEVEAEDEGATVRRGPAPEKAAKAEEVCHEILRRMGIEYRLEVRDDDENIVIVIDEVEDGSDVAEVLGRGRPPAIPALQFLLNKIVNRFPEDRKHINIEAPSVPKGERPRASAEPQPMPTLDQLRETLDDELDEALIRLGMELAQKALDLGKVITVHPMLPADRRAIHQTVTQIPGVGTVSDGEGLYRRMHVVPNALGGNGSGSRNKNKRRRRRRRGGRKGSTPTASA